jgi:hypothetical protein
MFIGDVIKQLRNNTQTFSGRIGGAAELAAAQQSGLLAAPAAYVIPADCMAGDNNSMTGLYQNMTEQIDVVVQFNNTAPLAVGDRRGQTTTEKYENVKFDLFHAILNWNPMNIHENPSINSPDPAVAHAIKGFYLVGGKLLEFDEARLYYSWRFGIDVVITEADGWTMTGVPLEEIDLSITNANDDSNPPGEVEVVEVISGLQDVNVDLEGVATRSRQGAINI